MRAPFAVVARSAPVLCFVVLSGTAIAGPAGAADADLIARGEYLTTAGDCVACHTAPGGKPFAGGLNMTTPFGTISTPNITPEPKTGIGDWTDDQFYRAMHEGISADGSYLYPVFPFPWYTKVTKPDVLAIKAYLFSLPPVNAPRAPNKLAFPFNVRTALAGWRLAFFSAGEYERDPKQSDAINRGAYLVQGLGHCGECHNSHNQFGASNWSGRLEGGEIEGWYAPNLTSNPHEGIGSWSPAQLAMFLKTGAAPQNGVVLGPMLQTIDESLSHLNDADLAAIAAYLKSVPAKQSYQRTVATTYNPTAQSGASNYESFCVACHEQNGRGQAGVAAALAGNGAVMARGPENVIRVVLGGLEAQRGLAPMPAVGAGMTDQEVADVVNYVRQSWGNDAPSTVGPGAVADLRKQTHTLLAGNAQGGCPPVAAPALAKAVQQSDVTAALQKITLGNMLEQIDSILPKVKAAVGKESDDDIVNGLTAAYCPVAMQDATLPPAERPIQLGTFAQLVYGRLKPAPVGNGG